MYGVRLSHVPTNEVWVIARSSDYYGARLSRQASGTYFVNMRLDFTSSNWNTAQTVYVKGGKTPTVENESVTIHHARGAWERIRHGGAQDADGDRGGRRRGSGGESAGGDGAGRREWGQLP